jgi:cyclopropane-fatty-acyl-phospholipid synthase
MPNPAQVRHQARTSAAAGATDPGISGTSDTPDTGRGAAAGRARSVADYLAPVIRHLFGGELPVRFRAWDGSEAGPDDGPTVVLTSKQALRRILWQPGELGLARAYVSGELEVAGDLTQALREVWRMTAEPRPQAGSRRDTRTPEHTGPRQHTGPRLSPAAWLAAAKAGIALGIPGPRPPAPATEARLSGRIHSRGRDRAVISHHYDVPAAFYELILDPAMAYSCALWTCDEPDYTLADAQRDKLDAICHKLELGPGRHLLDVGCGWGSLAIHAARSYGARVTAVTLAREQAAYVQKRVRDQGLGGLVTVRNEDYRDIGAGQYDAAASIEMGEHVGDRQYPAFCSQLRGQLRPGGRLLIQQMSRADSAPGGGRFIEAYIAADMHMRPAGETVAMLERAGLEIQDVLAMREHYVRTIRAWLARFELAFPQVAALIGAESARVWRLYMAGSALAFEESRMGVHQILATRPAA